MMNLRWINKNITSASIIVFFILYLLVIMIKPSLIYNKDGSLREFGIGQSKKTIMPIWLISILAGILSYLIVLYVITYPKLQY